VTLFAELVRSGPISRWALAAGVAVGIALAFLLLKLSVLRRLRVRAERTSNIADDLLVGTLERTTVFSGVIGALYAGWLVLNPPEDAARIADAVALLVLVVQLAIWGNRFVSLWTGLSIKRRFRDDAASATTLVVVGFFAKVVVWVIALLLVLENLGVDVTALVAGLGIGGIAVALALQNVLADLFGSVAIAVDRPFALGDFIVVGDLMGTVEHIGMKTTRLRSLSGEQLVFANNDLLKSRIRNYNRMSERRVVTSVGVRYETPPAQLEAIPGIVEEIVRGQEDVRFERVHFREFRDSALLFEIVYHVLQPGYAEYMDAQQAINLAIVKRFAAEKIGFAYPTQTVHIHHA